MPDKEGVANEFDGPWKVALELRLREFLELCFPAVHRIVDWRCRPEFLDTELQKLGTTHALGDLAVDRLVKVRLLDGRTEWLLIHVEVQAQRRHDFPERMWTYHYRIWDRYRRKVISLAVLADDDPSWRPNTYSTNLAGCSLMFQFPIFKVIDLPDPMRAFAETGNPFALVIGAHQAALATRRNPERRYARRFHLLRHLAASGLEPERMREIWKILQALTRLPPELELKFKAETDIISAMSIKDLMTPLEEIAMEEGESKSSRQAVVDALEARFGSAPNDLGVRLKSITDLARLRQLHRHAVTDPTLQVFLARL